jgi:ATP-dependent Clp protease ATP-binding subunit ClpA
VVVLDETLARALKQSKVRIDEPDPDTVCLRNVPANARFFNKPRTNVLIKRPLRGLPFLVCVDEDFEYTGPNPELACVFAEAARQRGWRVLSLAPDRGPEVADVIDRVLKAVGFNEREPVLKPAEPPRGVGTGALASVGTSVSRLAARGLAEPCVGRRDRIEEAICCLLQRHVAMPLVTAASGVGKTNFVHGVARALADLGRSRSDVIAVDLGALFSGTLFHSDRETLFADLLEEASTSTGTVLAMEHLELALAEVPHGPHLLARALDRGARLVGTTCPQHVHPFKLAPLARRIHVIELAALGPDDTCSALLAHRDRIAGHHGLAIPDALVRTAVNEARSLTGPLPATAIALLDAAAVSAALGGEAEVGLHHLYLAATRLPEIVG